MRDFLAFLGFVSATDLMRFRNVGVGYWLLSFGLLLGSELSPPPLAARLEAIQKAKNVGVMGPFSFTEGRDPADASGVVVLEMKAGKYRIFGETS